MRIERLLLLILGLVYISSGFAFSIDISPVNLNLDSKINNSYITLTNSSTKNFSLYVKMKKWEQNNGRDILADTHDFVVSPPLAVIKPESKQIFRIGFLKPLFADKELTYRIIFQQIPIRNEKKNKQGINFIYAFSIPVFVAPITPTNFKMDIQAKYDPTLKRVSLICSNLNNVHVQVYSIILYDPITRKIIKQFNNLTYLLANQSKDIEFILNNRLSKQLGIVVNTNQGKFNTHLIL